MPLALNKMSRQELEAVAKALINESEALEARLAEVRAKRMEVGRLLSHLDTVARLDAVRDAQRAGARLP